MQRSFSPLSAALLGAALLPNVMAQHVLGGEVTSLGIDDGEITPDGRFAVLRENTISSTAVVWDVPAGVEVARYYASFGSSSGTCCDAVAVTDTRAVVIGSSVQVLDLSAAGTARIAEHDAGEFPRDVAIDGLGRFAAVRGGDVLLVIELATGNVVLSLPSTTLTAPGPYDVDAAVATDDHAVMTDFDLGSTAGVTIVELAPPMGGGPRVVYQSPPNERLGGRPHDLTTSPDGQWCGVRSDDEIALYRLDGANSRLVWKRTPSLPVDPFDDSALDSIVLTDDWVFTFGRSGAPIGYTVMEAYDHLGGRASASPAGDPHDLTLTPDEARLVLRTSGGLGVVVVSNVQVGAGLPVLQIDVPSVVTGFGAGLDSVAASNTHAAAMFIRPNGPIGRTFRIDGSFPVTENTVQLIAPPLDVAFTPDGTRALFSSLRGVQVFDLRVRATTLVEQPIANGGWWPWCDGLAVRNSHAVAFGVGQVNGTAGWTTLLDLFDEPSPLCASGANSTGTPGVLVATGSSRPTVNDLTLWARNLPPNVVTYLAFGSAGMPFRYGDGVLCLTGPVVGRYVTGAALANGTLRIDLDQDAVSTGPGTFLAGTTWLFQLVHRDPGALTGFNATNGVSVPFID